MIKKLLSVISPLFYTVIFIQFIIINFTDMILCIWNSTEDTYGCLHLFGHYFYLYYFMSILEIIFCLDSGRGVVYKIIFPRCQIC